ncbi:TIGR04283 family arsenosugar biosynthesis glycosyltransferase [Methylomagnum sp.]
MSKYWFFVFIPALVWSAVMPSGYLNWFLEMLPAVGAFLILALTRRAFPLTNLSHVLLLILCLLILVGAHYGFGNVPVFEWLKPRLGWQRNNFDKLAHFFQGFAPAILFREILVRCEAVKRGWLWLVVSALTLALSAAYELVEWGAALALRERAEDFLAIQGDPWDAQSDMAIALLGAVAALTLLRHRHDRQIARLETYTQPLLRSQPSPDEMDPPGTAAPPLRLSIIMPAYNEAGVIQSTLAGLQAFRERGAEIIVVDGLSDDHTAELAAPLATRIIRSARGRATQMNTGARAATGEVLLFLHADTRLPTNADRRLAEVCAAGAAWGRFDVQFSGPHPALRIVESVINWRSRLSGMAGGDQAMFVRRDLFTEVGGFPEIPLMEDVALSRTLRRYARPACLWERAVASSRYWEEHGILNTLLLMGRLRLGYFLGADPVWLARRYHRR